MRFKNEKLALLSMLLTASVLFSQTEKDLILTNFNKTHFTEDSNFGIDLKINEKKYWTKLSEKFQTTFIKRGNNAFRAENKFNLAGNYELTENIDLQLLSNSYLLTDNQNINSNKTGWNEIFFGSKYNFNNNIYISPFVGLRSEEQIKKKNNGFAGKIIFKTEKYNLGDGELNTTIDLTESNLGERKYILENSDISYFKNYENRSINNINFSRNINRWDFYFPADNFVKEKYNNDFNLRERGNKNYSIANNLEYRVSENINTDFNFNFTSEAIENIYKYKIPDKNNLFDSKVNREKFELWTRIKVNFLNFSGNTYLRYSERNEQHNIINKDQNEILIYDKKAKQEARLNNISKITQIGSSILTNILPKTNLSIDFSTQILRYDTPDTTNFEDRDELVTNFGAKINQQIYENLKFAIGADYISHHLVYLFNQRSANNNQNKFIKLWGEITTNTKNVKHTLRSEVLANFTIFDFETKMPGIKSYIYREVGWIDSTQINYLNNKWINFYGTIRFYERGDLNWKDFKETPIQYFQEYSITPTIDLIKTEKYYLSFGSRGFLQKRFEYDNFKEKLVEEFSSFGPTIIGNIFVFNKGELSFKIWEEKQTSTNGYKQNFTNMNIDFKWIL